MAGVPFLTPDLPTMSGDLVAPSDTVPLSGNVRYVRAGSAAAVVLRYPGSAADITITAGAGEYIPVGPGTIIRLTGTVATPLHAFGN